MSDLTPEQARAEMKRLFDEAARNVQKILELAARLAATWDGSPETCPACSGTLLVHAGMRQPEPCRLCLS